MSEYKEGQRIHVEFDGTVTGQSGSIVYVTHDTEKMGGYEFEVHSDSVTLLDPAGWPPQVGDIWEAEGREYYVRKNEYSHLEEKRQIVMVPDAGSWVDLDDLKGLNPVLVRRRGQ